MNLAFEFLLDRSDGDPEDALAALKHVDDLIGAVCGIDGGAIRQQRHVGERSYRSASCSRRISMALRIFFRLIPASSSRLTTLSCTMSVKE